MAFRPRRVPIHKPTPELPEAAQESLRKAIEPFVYGRTANFQEPASAGVVVNIPNGLGATLKKVRYYSAISIGSPHLPALGIEYGGRAAYLNMLTQSPYILLVEPEGEVDINVEVPPNTSVRLTEKLINATTFLALAYALRVVVQYQIEGELWRP